jgi:hypothetical protein
MLRPVLVLASAVLILGACNRQSPTSPAATPAGTAPVAASTVAPAPAKVAAQVPTGPSFSGYGAARFGMSGQETRQAMGSAYAGKAAANAGDCYVLSPSTAKSPRDFSIMMQSDKFVRYDVGNADDVAPGGGKVGMTAEQVRALYDGRIREQPDKYVPGGVDMRVSADDGSGSALIFQTDAGGKVTGWRVGQSPAVDYVEGCS